jgi:rhodanese-related sulfurtransferase
MISKQVSRILGVALALLLPLVGAGVAPAAQWANPELLVSPETVAENIGKPNWVVVDCRPLKDYAKGHIPGAISLGNRCDKALRDSTARIFRDISKYEKLLGKVGIGNDTHVILYHGDLGTLTRATVAFWVLEYLGHDKVHLLNGGLDAWRKAGNRLDNKPTMREATTFKANVVASAYRRNMPARTSGRSAAAMSPTRRSMSRTRILSPRRRIRRPARWYRSAISIRMWWPRSSHRWIRTSVPSPIARRAPARP